MNTEREELMHDLDTITSVCRDFVSTGDWGGAAECWERQAQIARKLEALALLESEEKRLGVQGSEVLP